MLSCYENRHMAAVCVLSYWLIVICRGRYDLSSDDAPSHCAWECFLV